MKPPEPKPDELVGELRERISAADRSIVEAINARLELVERLRRHKQSLGLGFVDRDREARMREELRRLNAGPLSDEGLDEIFTAILELTKREIGAAVRDH